MTLPTKKLVNGCEIGVLALGTLHMGGGKKKDLHYQYEQRDINVIRRAYELGLRRFDTAEVYAEGYSEEILGKALKDYPREEVFVTSKVLESHLAYDDVMRSVEASLHRLQMDYLDMYLIHAPNHTIPIQETMRAFNQLKDQGLIRHIGVSNFSSETLKEAQDAAHSPIVLNQVHYNLIFREPQLRGLLEYCQHNDVFIEAWRPLEEGNLSHNGITLVDTLAHTYQKTPSQLALNWLIAQKNVVAVFKTRSIDHLTENLGAVGWELKPADVDTLSRDFPIQLDRSNAVRLG